MDIDQVINHLGTLKKYCVDDASEHGLGIHSLWTNDVKALEFAIKELSKRKIKRVKFIADYGEGFYKGTCPGCGLFIKMVDGQKYCQHCGQRIDWGLGNGR